MKWCENDELHCSASNPTEIANMFNRYFYSVFQPSDSNIDEIDFSESNCDQTSTIASIVLTTEEIYHVLSNLDENKATGPDKIPAALLKNCASSISKSLCELFNKSLASGKLPDEWKLSHIIPIPKKCPNDEVTNYRPISLLSVVSKVLERCIYNQLIVHVSSQLHHLQFGFLRDRSTTSQLLHVINEINKALENREQIDSIYLDFAKAFDKVDHILLLKKLRNFGKTGKLLNCSTTTFQTVCRKSPFLSVHLSRFLFCLEFLRDLSLVLFFSSSLSTICPTRFLVNHRLLYSLTTRSAIAL